MGAEFDVVWNPNDDVDEAYAAVVEDALYWCGHQGYSGTLAEKPGYVVLRATAPNKEEGLELAERIDRECVDHPRPEYRRHPSYKEYSSDKWGPAGAIKLDDGGWLFFGWCSS
jgi:hypothetical protein